MSELRAGWVGEGRVLEVVRLYTGRKLGEKKEYKVGYSAWEMLGDSEDRVMVTFALWGTLEYEKLERESVRQEHCSWPPWNLRDLQCRKHQEYSAKFPFHLCCDWRDITEVFFMCPLSYSTA